MKASFHIATKLEGTLGEILAHELTGTPVVMEAPPTLEEVLKVLGDVTFIAETVAHLQGKETSILPTTDKARKILDALQPRNV